jgi:hypothetical protein
MKNSNSSHLEMQKNIKNYISNINAPSINIKRKPRLTEDITKKPNLIE